MNRIFRCLRIIRPFSWALLLGISGAAVAQTTVSVNVDYAEGRYGESEKSSTWTMPLIVRHQAGNFYVKLNMPYVRATGTAVAGGDRFSTTRQVQEGYGDLVISSAYGILSSPDSGFALDIGAKAKIATADKQNDLITTGKNDYSAMLDAFQTIGGVSIHASLGWTKKGDPEGVNYRDPWFSALGLSYKISDGASIGTFYDFRQKVTSGGDPVKEGMIFSEFRFAGGYRMLAYVVRGFSDASPDLGAGVTFSVRF
ncbi:MAG: hypothetical protein H6R14_334 [Proteobacteria bacterium]|nr:hypothetical protein [Pseudomonadota bacterium]